MIALYPIFVEALEAQLDELPRAVAVAVSGGADSFALLHMAQQWCRKKRINLQAFTVDHGLRAESKREAEAVAKWCAENNIPHEILFWEGEKPKTGLQDAARIARKQLLGEACARRNISHLLLGHHADDQAETVLMRLQRGSGLKGVLGMRPLKQDEFSAIEIIRPLLELRRQSLRDYAAVEKLPFHDDPSNEDTRFERTRVREALKHLPELANGLGKSLARLGEIHETLQILANEWFEENHEAPEEGQIWLHGDLVTLVLPPIQDVLLDMVLAECGATDIPLDGLERLRMAMAEPDFSGQTLAGVWVRPKTIDGETGFLFQKAPKRKK